jgi:hypothetical protein
MPPHAFVFRLVSFRFFCGCTVPRNFVLLDELKMYNKGEGGMPHGCSIGQAKLTHEDHLASVELR